MNEKIAIIGTREPDGIQEIAAFELAFMLTLHYEIIVKTGAAMGIDHKAMQGASCRIPILLEVVLPWDRYNHEIIPEGAKITVASSTRNPEWYRSVQDLHPAPYRLTTNARHLHARNYGIVEGTKLVVAMPNPKGGGGTAQGIRVARSLDIPVLQFDRGTVKDPETILAAVRNFLK